MIEQQTNLKTTNLQTFKTCIFYCFILLLLLFFYKAPRISIPLVLTLTLEVVLRPFIPKLERLGLNKTLILVISICIFLCLIILPIIKSVPIIKHELDNIEYYLPKGEELLRLYFYKIAHGIKKYTNIDVGAQYLNQIIEFTKDTSKLFLFNLPSIVAQFVEWLFLIPLFLFFLIRDNLKFKSFFIRLIPNSIFEQSYYLMHQFHRNLGKYIFAKIFEASILGIMTTIGLLLLDVRFSFILGPFAAITNIVPYLGPIIGPIPGLIVAMIDYGTSSTFWGVVLVYSITNLIDMTIIFPILVARIVDLHPLIVVVSVVLGHQYAGITGMIISIPMAAIIKLITLEILGNK